MYWPGTEPAVPTTVLGFELEPGERVVFLREHSYRGLKIALIVFGVLTLVMLVGFFVLYAAFTGHRKHPKAHVITTRRLLSFPYDGPPDAVPLASIVSVAAERVHVKQSGGPPATTIGTAIGAVIVARKQAAQNQLTQLDPAYWKHSVGVLLTMKNGAVERLPCPVGAPEVGLALARIVNGDRLEPTPPAGRSR